MEIVILVGNPSPQSRTLQLATALADAVAPVVGETKRRVIDLAEYAGSLFDFGSDEVAALNAEVAACDLLLIASPTYKAAYTGLLKAFLDRYDTNGLAGVAAIPIMTGGSPGHTLAPDLTLRPLLVELGASTPTRSLYFLTSQMPAMSEILAAWVEANQRALQGVAAAARGVAPPAT